MASALDTLNLYSDPALSGIQRHRALAQALMQEGQQSGPVASPWAAVNRAVSPLLGALTAKRADEQMGELSASAAPELAQIAQSDNPVALAAASKNPLVRALLPELVQMQVQGGFDTRGAAAREAAVGKAKLSYEPDLTRANAEAQYGTQLQYAPKIAGATAAAENPYAISRAAGIAKATLPYDIAKTQAAAKASIEAQLGALGDTFGGAGPGDSFVAGQTYTDAQGNKAIYRGNGKWEEIP